MRLLLHIRDEQILTKLVKQMYNSTPSGYRHIWRYKGRWNEKKVRKGLWRFNFIATKNKKSNSYGQFGKGTKGAWKINAIQYIVKVGKGRYQTRMIGTKKPLKFYVKRTYKPRRYHRYYNQ